MTVRALADTLSLTILTGSDEALDAAVSGGYCGDLLSWVMGRAPAEGVWLTIMSNINVAAVATLSEVACVILCEDVEPDAELLERMRKGGQCMLKSPLPVFTLAGKLASLV